MLPIPIGLRAAAPSALALALVLASCAEDRPRGGAGGGLGSQSHLPRAQRTTCSKVDAIEGPEGRFAAFAFEASRPNASEDDGGEGDALPACSETGIVPWTRITWEGAEAACARTGWRLCTQDEWLQLCGGRDNLPQPYGHVFKAGRCNDHKGGSGTLEPCGNRPECVSPVGAYDVIGNAWEWIADPGDGAQHYLGYSYQVIAIRPQADPKCDAGLQNNTPGYDRPEVGFRCCRDL